MNLGRLAEPAQRLWHLLLDTYGAWRADRTIRMGAGLAYYGLFSLTSVIAVSLAIVRIIGRNNAVEEAFTDRLEEFIGDNAQAAETVANGFEQLTGAGGSTLGLIGIGALLVSGSLFFLALEDAVNQIFHVPVASGIKSSLRRRAVSLVVLLGACLTIIAALAVQAATSIFERILPGTTPASELLSTAVTTALGWALLAGALGLLFRYLPAVEVRWRYALTGAVVTSILLVIGTSLAGWYLRTVGASSIGGVASTPIAILVWIYYAAQILLAGVQLTKVLSRDP